jgi:hypothetical protein
MSLYNLLFGMNSQSDLLLAVIGLRKVDIERLRDVHVGSDTITVYTRTGGGNREGYPNAAMRARPEWRGSEDDDFDSTYCTDTFAIPEQWRADVAALGDILVHGMRPEFAQHLALTLRREPTEADREQALYEREQAALARTKHHMANGHTFVPHDDSALKVALDLAEANGGKLRSCWGIAPLALTVKRDFHPYPQAKSESDRAHFVRVDVSYDFTWAIDMGYWQHMQTRFGASHPMTMAEIAETVARQMKRAA